MVSVVTSLWGRKSNVALGKGRTTLILNQKHIGKYWLLHKGSAHIFFLFPFDPILLCFFSFFIVSLLISFLVHLPFSHIFITSHQLTQALASGVFCSLGKTLDDYLNSNLQSIHEWDVGSVPCSTGMVTYIANAPAVGTIMNLILIHCNDKSVGEVHKILTAKNIKTRTSETLFCHYRMLPLQCWKCLMTREKDKSP